MISQTKKCCQVTQIVSFRYLPFFAECRLRERFSMNPDLEFRKRGILIRARGFENKKTKITRQEERV